MSNNKNKLIILKQKPKPENVASVWEFRQQESCKKLKF